MIPVWFLIAFAILIYFIYKCEYPTGFEHIKYFDGPKLYPIIGGLGEIWKHSASMYGLFVYFGARLPLTHRHNANNKRLASRT